MAKLDSQKTYRVVGALRVHDTRPGDEFTAALDPGQEDFLLAVGHIVVVPKRRGADPSDAGNGAGEKEKA